MNIFRNTWWYIGGMIGASRQRRISYKKALWRLHGDDSNKFLKTYQKGDKIWEYNTLSSPLGGGTGIYIKRNNEIIAQFIFIIS